METQNSKQGRHIHNPNEQDQSKLIEEDPRSELVENEETIKQFEEDSDSETEMDTQDLEQDMVKPIQQDLAKPVKEDLPKPIEQDLVKPVEQDLPKPVEQDQQDHLKPVKPKQLKNDEISFQEAETIKQFEEDSDSEPEMDTQGLEQDTGKLVKQDLPKPDAQDPFHQVKQDIAKLIDSQLSEPVGTSFQNVETFKDPEPRAEASNMDTKSPEQDLAKLVKQDQVKPVEQDLVKSVSISFQDTLVRWPLMESHRDSSVQLPRSPVLNFFATNSVKKVRSMAKLPTLKIQEMHPGTSLEDSEPGTETKKVQNPDQEPSKPVDEHSTKLIETSLQETSASKKLKTDESTENILPSKPGIVTLIWVFRYLNLDQGCVVFPYLNSKNF